MSLLNEIFEDNACYFLADEAVLLQESFTNTGDVVFQQIDGKAADTVDSFMKTTAAQFSFPAHFGHNWSAFSDSFTDWIADVDAKRYLLLFSHADHLLLKEPTQQFLNFFSTLDFILTELKAEGECVLKIMFLVEDAKQSHLGNHIAQSKHGGRVISSHE